MTWKVWQLRCILAQTVKQIDRYELASRRGLSVSPETISTIQASARTLKTKYKFLLMQWHRLELILVLLARIQAAFKWFYRRTKSSNPKRRKGT